MARVDRFWRLPVEHQHQIDEVDAAFEERPVRHRSTPRHRLVPRREIHQLGDLTERDLADVRVADPLLDRAKHRLLAVLVVDRNRLPHLGRYYDHLIGLGHRLDERLLADHVRAAAQSFDAEIPVRRRRSRDHDHLGPALLEKLGETRVRR